MKISLMVLLIITIAALSHVTIARTPGERVATEQLPRGIWSVAPRFAIGDRTMWISIFAVVILAAFFLGVAAFLMQPAEVI